MTGIFFDGQQIVSPAVRSKVNDSAMYNPNPNVGNILALIGTSVAGAPNTPLRFGNPEDARAALVSGELLDAVVRAFDPSADVGAGPATIIAVRVNPAVRSTLDLLNAGATAVINLASTDYGLLTNQIKVKVEAGTTRGFKVTTQYGTAAYVGDDIYRGPFKIRYSGGQATARVIVTGSTLTLEAPNSTPVAVIDLATYKTVQMLVDRINAVAGFAASVLEGGGAFPTLQALDGVTGQDVKTADYVMLANLQAVVDWFNTSAEGLITATRASGATAVPVVSAFTYLAGGSDGTTTNTNYQNALTVLQTEDVQWITPCTSDPSIHAMVDAHVAYMSSIALKERRAIVGAPLATTDIAAIALAKAINSDRTSLVHIGGYDYDASGTLVLYPPYIVAAMVAGGFAGLDPGESMTNKSLKLRGVERKIRNPTDTDPLILGGVIPIEAATDGYRVVQAISTWLTNDNFNRVEVAAGASLDFTARAMRDAVKSLKGAKGSPQTLGEAKSRTVTCLSLLAQPSPVGPGVLVGDADNPAFKNVVCTLVGDRISIRAEVRIGITINYVTIEIFAVPYSGTASI